MTSPKQPAAAKASLPDALTTQSLAKIVLPLLARGLELAEGELREKGLDYITAPTVQAARLAVHESAQYAGVDSPIRQQ